MILDAKNTSVVLHREKLGFKLFIPGNFEYRDMSLRIKDRKWDTFRFFSSVDGISLRVKEFFLDWFYTGFPKSLLSSFIGTYSPVQHAITKNGIIFYGKNYRGNDSVSLNINGTQIEVESTVPAPINLFMELIDDLHPYQGVDFDCSMPFLRRSFYAAGKHGDWYEDNRISRMKWENPRKEAVIKIAGIQLSASSVGNFGNGEFHRIIVLENDCFNKVSWIDFCTFPNSIDQSFYNIRKECCLFDSFIFEENRKYVFRKNSGPALYQFFRDGHLYTVSLSPNIPIPELEYWKSIEDLIMQLCWDTFRAYQ
ncbi:hypothetical protein OXIME_000627 [Oxyplasma meridianum]|uniref:Uncharacterized protein n=1 Tax=Oxyplasma meridianum TaxID=3073602 RepID=A0AAX4NFM3_9ARCH